MTGSSLKRLITDVSTLTGMSQAAVYERQRALVRARLLKTERGRGPGSGVRGTPESMALLLISLLATGNLSDVGLSTSTFANLENKEDSCPLTGKRTLAEAVTALLASKELARSIITINLSQETKESEIAYRDPSKGGSISSSKFGLAGPEGPGLRMSASLSGDVVERLAYIFEGEARP
jgi:hypothetical protein